MLSQDNFCTYVADIRPSLQTGKRPPEAWRETLGFANSGSSDPTQECPAANLRSQKSVAVSKDAAPMRPCPGSLASEASQAPITSAVKPSLAFAKPKASSRLSFSEKGMCSEACTGGQSATETSSHSEQHRCVLSFLRCSASAELSSVGSAVSL